MDRDLNYGRHILRDALRAITVQRVLDVGGGLGADLATVHDAAPGAELYAVESNHHYANALRKAGVTVTHGDLERSRLPFEDESIDLVVANQILEHVKEVFWILHEISRVLKVGGHLFIGVPNLASLHNRLLLLLGRQPTCINNASAHVRGFTKRDVLNFMQTCWPGGYEMVSFRGSNFYPLPQVLAKPMASMLPTAAVSIFFLLMKRSPYAGQFLEHPENLETNFFLGAVRHHVFS
jgi:ubiquinone/menaquinone biosynthesis C-methylase UbiE